LLSTSRVKKPDVKKMAGLLVKKQDMPGFIQTSGHLLTAVWFLAFTTTTALD
jgi:hypothetical protein